MQLFRLSLSYHLSLRRLFGLFLSGRFKQVALFVFLVSRDCCGAFPQDAMGLSAVCEYFLLTV